MKKLLLVMSLLVIPLYAVEEICEYKAVFFLDSAEIGDIRIPGQVASEITGLQSVETRLDRTAKLAHWNLINPDHKGEMIVCFQAHNLKTAFEFFHKVCENREIRSG